MSENFNENEYKNKEVISDETEIIEEGIYEQKSTYPTFSENTSGEGDKAFVPDTVKNKFNWGAFLMTWVWGIFNNSFITLTFVILMILTLISSLKISAITFIFLFLDLIFMIWFGIKGNTWAWQNKRYSGIARFHEVQKKWAIGSLIFIVVCAAASAQQVANFIIKINEVFAGT